MFKGLKFFIRMGWKYDKFYILWSFLNQLLKSFLPIITVLLPKYIIDELLGDQQIKRIALYISILTLYTLFTEALSTYFEKNIFVRRCRINAEFDSDLHKLLCACDYENLENPRFLDLKQRAEKFLYCDWHGFGYLLDCAMNIFGKSITLLSSIAILLSMNPWLIILYLGLSAIGAKIQVRAQKKAWTLSSEVAENQRGWRYYSDLFEDFAYGKEIRMNNMADVLLQKERLFFTKALKNIGKQNNAFIEAGVWEAGLNLIRQIVTYGFLVSEILVKKISIGSFTMYIGATATFTTSLSAIMNGLAEIAVFDYYFDDLESYINIPSKLRLGSKKADTEVNQIEFRHVSYRYPGSDTFALKDVNLIITGGEKLMLVGENGAGKTTFVKLLVRLYEPTEGSILLNGLDIREYDYDTYMELFSTVFQDFKMFPVTILENISLGLPKDQQRAETILRNLGFGDKLASLPDGIHTNVLRVFDDRGFEPSGGEGQKIALARAVYKDANIMILDEPTSALDPRAECELYKIFHEMVRGKTALFISHRLGSAKLCDKIIVLNNGCLMEYGTHEDLIEQKGLYASYFSMQAEHYT